MAGGVIGLLGGPLGLVIGAAIGAIVGAGVFAVALPAPRLPKSGRSVDDSNAPHPLAKSRPRAKESR